MDKETREVIEGFLSHAKKKLEVAERLRSQGDWADAISRAYYAAFHAAQALLLAEGFKARTHRGVVALFGLHFVKTGRVEPKFSKYLQNLQDDRERGDYEVYAVLDEADALDALREAREFLTEAERQLKPYLSTNP